MTDIAPTPEAQVIVDTATVAAAPKVLIPDALAAVVLPMGGQVELVDLEAQLEQYRPNPRRATGTVSLSTGASFEAYINNHATDATAMYADVDRLRVVGVINGHTAQQPGWGDYRAVLQLRKTPEWQRWAGKDGQMLDQVAFAEHVEQGLAEIIDPPAAEMLEMAQTLQAKIRVDFKSSQILQNGQRQLQYEETIDAKAGEKGNLTIPATFEIGVAPFEGAVAYKIAARLRFRIREGKLNIGYQLDRPDVVLRTAFDDVLVSIEAATSIAAYHGTVGE